MFSSLIRIPEPESLEVQFVIWTRGKHGLLSQSTQFDRDGLAAPLLPTVGTPEGWLSQVYPAFRMGDLPTLSSLAASLWIGKPFRLVGSGTPSTTSGAQVSS